MKLQFKKQAYQTRAVEAVINCFEGQPYASESSYSIDPGRIEAGSHDDFIAAHGLKNKEIALSKQQLLENIKWVQRSQNLPQSTLINEFKTIKKNEFVVEQSYTKKALALSPYHLDVEMETGTGKTYCYIKTIFEMNQRYGWSKFIIVVPSIAIREGVYKSLEITADHFQEDYGKKAKTFIYNSKQLHKLESFSSDHGINIMIINVQAFNSTSKDNRRIYEELDNFQSRRPIDVIKANRPILILDEPQKMEGKKTLESLEKFNALFVLRYSATHKTRHHLIHRLDALDAYNQKLVKKIAVRGISMRGLPGTNTYLYLESIEISTQAPVARMEMEIKQRNGIKRIIRNLKKGAKLYDLSNKLEQYAGFVIADINAMTDTVEFTNGHKLQTGVLTGDVNEKTLRKIQLREAINAHFKKEQALYQQKIKVLTLFFIDEVAKYRVYSDDGEKGGEYAVVFEEEYKKALKELKEALFIDEDYKKHLDAISVEHTHNGYFSIDKKGNMIDAVNKTKAESDESTDQSAYDLILKDKERLLSFDEPTRFIFSHSALREGWDNPNVFVICTLKHSDSNISRRQEIGRGLRIAVNQQGDRQDDPTTVHETNVLTVITSESYEDFVSKLQKEISDSLSERPRVADAKYFTGKMMQTNDGTVEVTEDMAAGIEHYLVENQYVDHKKNIVQKYYDAVEHETLASLSEDLQPYKEAVHRLIKNVYSDIRLPQIGNDRDAQENPLNANFEKKAFQALWDKINHKAVYSVHFDRTELIDKCIQTLNKELKLKVTPLQYTVHRGEQTDNASYEQIQAGDPFVLDDSSTGSDVHSIHSVVKYDLIGKVAENVQLTRKTVTEILSGIEKPVFAQFKTNPEHFISEAARLIQEQKATVIIEKISYDTVAGTYAMDIFTNKQSIQDFSKNNVLKDLKKHIYNCAITDSQTERNFVQELDNSSEVVVYAKLPTGFAIPTPVGNYNPDWAIAFNEGSVKHIYFVAETKGAISSMELRGIEQTKIECARKFFTEVNKRIALNKHVKYDVVTSYGRLMAIVGGVAIPT